MIDTDKYEGHSKTIKTGCWKRSDKMGFKSESVFDESGKTIASVKLAGYDTKRVKETYANLLLITDAPLLLEEVKRLREELEEAKQKRDKYLGALDSAIEQIGYTGMGIDYEERMREDAGITVYGDEYLRCDCEGCSGLVKDKYDDYIIKGRGDQESVKCDFDECPYFYGDEEE